VKIGLHMTKFTLFRGVLKVNICIVIRIIRTFFYIQFDVDKLRFKRQTITETDTPIAKNIY